MLRARCSARDCSNIFREGSNKHRHLVVNGPAVVSLMSWTDKLQNSEDIEIQQKKENDREKSKLP